ncbi:hypothetical protein QYE76_066987 [Lolium multiflorum]|uniref:Transposase (putative) gypsy type domain-containing protein n=1 Tax=Lolium multiflorum TaxID=4521 RepID=A0AAD8SDR0_LOLMU|nr:hypothetical protein QYE76_066987 [Lolium multiflorum]
MAVKIRLLLPGLDFIHLDLQQLGRPMGRMPPSPSVGHPGLPDLGHAVDIPIKAQRTKSGNLSFADATGNRHTIDAGNMSTSSPRYTDSSLNSPDSSSKEPSFPEPLAFLPPHISDTRLAQPFSASSSNALGRIPTLQEIQEELEGQARMAAKVQEVVRKKGSKARNREAEKGQWWPCEVKDSDLRELQEEGMISPHWSIMKDSVTPKPNPDERVLTKAWVERGLSLPCSEFFLSVLTTYGLQPHNICPNSYLLLSNFVTLCEGHLGIHPDIRLWQFFFRVKKETKDKMMVNCGSMTFMLHPGRIWFSRRIQPLKYNTRLICEYTWVDDLLRVTRDNLPVDSLKRRIKTLVKFTWGQPVPEIVMDIKTNNQCPPLNTLAEEDFRAILREPSNAEGAEEDPEDDDDEEEQAPKKAAPRPAKRPRAKVSGSEAGASGETSAKKAKTVKPPTLDSKKAERERHKLLQMQGKDRAPLFPEPRKYPRSSLSFRNFGDPTNLLSTPKAYSHKFFHKLTEAEKWDLEQDLLNSMMVNGWGKADVETSDIQLHKKEMCDFFDQLLVKRKVHLPPSPTHPPSSRACTPPIKIWRPNWRRQTKKREQEEKQLTEKKSELLQKEADFVLKRQVDSDTLQKLQKEVNGLQNYMTTAGKGWDLLKADVTERRNQVPHDNLIRLAGDDCRDLISACRKICHSLNIKDSRTCDINELIKRMDVLPALVVDLQASSARGAAQMSLAMCLAWSPDLDIDLATTGVPPNTDVNALLDACSGYDTRIARRIPHDEFYDKVVLPADELLEAE